MSSVDSLVYLRLKSSAGHRLGGRSVHRGYGSLLCPTAAFCRRWIFYIWSMCSFWILNLHTNALTGSEYLTADF